jgi:tetratricopeptide (TPR) repeat protein
MSKKNKATQPSTPKTKIPENQHSEAKTQNPKIWFWTCIGVLVIAVFIAFSGGFNNNFVDWDDGAYVTDSPIVQKPNGNWGKAWTTHVALNYHPLTITSLMLNSDIFGADNARPFIVTNTLIHLLNALLVFWFVLLLLKNKEEESIPITGKPLFVAFFTALVFAIHPLKVESVIWVSERKDVLYSLFFLLGCINYLKYLDNTQTKKYLIYSFSLFILSCLSKGQAVVFPVVLLLLDYWNDRKFDTKTIIEKIPFLLISLLFGVIASSIQAGDNFYGLIKSLDNGDYVAVNTQHNLWNGIKYAAYGLSQYWVKFFFPYSLSSFYPVTLWKQGPLPYNFPFGIVFSLFIVGAFIFSFKKSKVIFFGIAFFGITFFLVSQILLVGGAIMADRYTYLPYIGLAFMVFYFLADILEKGSSQKYGLLAILIGFMLFFVIKTRNQVKVWENTRTLMTQRVDLLPADDRAHYNIAKYSGEKENNYELCISEYLKCLETTDSTKLIDVWANIATAYSLKGDYPKAIEYYTSSIKKEPKVGVHYMNRGFQYLKTQQPEKALPDLEKASVMTMKKDDRASVFGGLGTAQLNVGKTAEAYNNLNIAIDKESSKDAIHFFNRGVARLKLFNDKTGALADVKASLKLNPNYADALNGLKVLEGAK